MRESKVGAPKAGGGRACEEGAIPVPSALLPALSHGVLEKGAGWPDWLARPWGQREGPRPARGAAPLSSPPLPSRVPGQGMSCSRRSLPGARGQGGPGGVLPSSPPPYLLPAQVRAGAAATAAAPDSRRPRAGGALGVGPGEGLGGALRRAGKPAPSGGRALRGRAPPEATYREPSWLTLAVPSRSGRLPPRLLGRWESGLRTRRRESPFPLPRLPGAGNTVPCPFSEDRIHPLCT